MNGETISIGTADDESEEGKRERSTISFPYGDLGDAIQVAEAVHHFGGVSATASQVAAHMEQKASSGNFRLKVSAARIFGLTENERKNIRLTDLGRRIVDEAQLASAKAEAFLTVPLYKAIFDEYDGHTLPPPAGLERQMAALGVAKKVTDKARQAFERSALAAGFFAHGNNRLVMPPLTSKLKDKDEKPSKDKEDEGAGNGGGGSGGGDLHPFILGLLEELPDAKTDWDISKRVEWLQAAEQVFKLIYKDKGGGTIKIEFNSRSDNPMRGRIVRESDQDDVDPLS